MLFHYRLNKQHGLQQNHWKQLQQKICQITIPNVLVQATFQTKFPCFVYFPKRKKKNSSIEYNNNLSDKTTNENMEIIMTRTI